MAFATSLGSIFGWRKQQIQQQNAVALFAGRIYRASYDTLWGVSTLFSTREGMDKTAKLASAFFQLAVKVCEGTPLPKIQAMIGASKEFTDFNKGLNVFDRLKEFTECDHKGRLKILYNSDTKIVSRVFLFGANALDSVNWCQKMGLLNLGQVSKTVGSERVFGSAIANTGLKIMSDRLIMVSAILSIADNCRKIEAMVEGKAKIDDTKAWLGIASDVGKIGLVAFQSYAMTYAFIAWAILTGIAQITKILYEASKAEK